MEEMLLSGLDLSPMITHRFHVNDFQKGFDVMEEGNCGKAVSSGDLFIKYLSIKAQPNWLCFFFDFPMDIIFMLEILSVNSFFFMKAFKQFLILLAFLMQAGYCLAANGLDAIDNQVASLLQEKPPRPFCFRVFQLG